MSCSDIAHFALLYKHCVKQFKGTLGSIAWVLIHARYPARKYLLHLGKSTKFVGTVILSPSNYSLWTLSAAIKTVVSAYLSSPQGWEFDSKWRLKGREIDS